MRGYFGNDKANSESFDQEGYFQTGDILYCDSKTMKWFIVDRKKVQWFENRFAVLKLTKFATGADQSSWVSSCTTRA